MCGRFALYTDPLILARHFAAEMPPEWGARYNVAPSQNILTIREEGEKRRFALARWGLVPSWAKEMDTGYSTINARAETVASKPAFRSAFQHRRCLIPADGFYEWQVVAGSKPKQPWFIALKSREPLAFAGLWESWRNPQEGDEVESCTIIVTDANDLMKRVHDRMPVILGPKDWPTWLTTEACDTQTLQNLLKPYPPAEMTAWPVSLMVNNVRHDARGCIEPAQDKE
jgi:putative SOS response-associated peptidase YedK